MKTGRWKPGNCGLSLYPQDGGDLIYKESKLGIQELLFKSNHKSVADLQAPFSTVLTSQGRYNSFLRLQLLPLFAVKCDMWLSQCTFNNPSWKSTNLALDDVWQVTVQCTIDNCWSRQMTLQLWG